MSETTPLLRTDSPFKINLPNTSYHWLTFESLQRRSDQQFLLVAISSLCVFLILAVGFYGVALGWGVVDSIYFAVVTLTTVGYGDLTPMTHLQKLFTCAFAFLAVGLIAYSFGFLLSYVMDKEEARFDWMMEEEGSEPKSSSFLCSLCLLAAVLLVGAALFAYLEHKSFTNALYWSCITVTTIGYGDTTPKTQAGKAFAIPYILLGTFAAGNSLRHIVEWPLQLRRRKNILLVERQFGDHLETEELQALVALAKELGMKADCYVTRAQFTLTMLVQLGKVTPAELKECYEQFDTLDKTHDGRLGSDNVLHTIARANSVLALRKTM
eukprot:NODE_2659_length_1124_cov_42.620863_g2537_i0.p1 GENE.NODE_2659_length_1124_cov_42.620863_g2537_i0~~NODE_2659_length_1124_cov_42.620863_g2537_i0.p1  ORF type:complete len:339 (-),score=95.02 NODE_2659_length_1124_cov_42.620863_g2537_i0:108-1082(-)